MDEPGDRLRIDKWLWAARFFKTRSLAAQAVEGGRIRLNGERPKPARHVKPGDELVIHIGELEWIVRVRAVSPRRGPAEAARLLYDEDEASRAKRQAILEARRQEPDPGFGLRGRPTKREAVRWMLEGTYLSGRRAYRLVGLSRDAFRHPPEQAPATPALSARIIELAQLRRRFGYRRLHDLLRLEYPTVNHKTVYRLYREADLAVRRRRKVRRRASQRQPLSSATAPNAAWTSPVTLWRTAAA